MNFKGCKDFSTSLKPIPYFDVFADKPCRTSLCTRKNFLHSHAANFRRSCLSCIYDAKVRFFLEIRKFVSNFFIVNCELKIMK